MSRQRRTIEHFASRAGMSPELAIELLGRRAFRPLNPSAVIPKRRVLLAELILGLAPKRALRDADAARHQRKAEVERLKIQKREQRRLQREATRPAQEQELPPSRADGLPLIGRREAILYVKADAAEKIHDFLVREFATTRDPIVPAGVKDPNLLYSAMTRYQTSLGNDLKYPTLPLASAALLHSLIHNHPFHNGNKRTALVTCLTFMDLNGICLRADEGDLFEFIMQIGKHAITLAPAQYALVSDHSDREVWAIADWLHGRQYRKMIPSRFLKFRQLRSILLNYGCLFETTKRSAINIARGDLKTQVWYGGEGREADPGMIHKIRVDLQLDEAHGYDSALFYNAEQRLPDFTSRYRKTLDLLAKQ